MRKYHMRAGEGWTGRGYPKSLTPIIIHPTNGCSRPVTLNVLVMEQFTLPEGFCYIVKGHELDVQG